VGTYIALTTKSHRAERGKTFNGVRTDTSFAKWGNLDKFLLNGVIIVRNDNLGDKNGIYFIGDKGIVNRSR
jgi:hypothetical protein